MDNTNKITDDLVKEFITWEFNGESVDVFINEWERFKKSKEVKKEPLFTTEDGKEIFENDTYWTMDKNAFEYWYSGAASYVFNSGKGEGMLFFSTEEEAKKYILFNKPLLTIKEIKCAIDIRQYSIGGYPVGLHESLIELAKKKINGK